MRHHQKIKYKKKPTLLQYLLAFFFLTLKSSSALGSSFNKVQK